MNKEFLYMQKLAGIITESEYVAKIEELEVRGKVGKQYPAPKSDSDSNKKEFYMGSVDGFDVYEIPKGRKDLYAVALELGIIPGVGWVHPTDVGVESYFDQYIEKGPLFIFIKPGSKEKYVFSYEKKQFQNKDGGFIKEHDPNIINLFKFIESKKPEYKTPIEIKLLQSPELISPEDLNVKGNINLWYSHLKSLPDNLTVNGNLNIRKTQITSLPNNLTVGGDLEVIESNLSSIPNNLTVKGRMNVAGTPLGEKYSDKKILKMIKNKGGKVKEGVVGGRWVPGE